MYGSMLHKYSGILLTGILLVSSAYIFPIFIDSRIEKYVEKHGLVKAQPKRTSLQENEALTFFNSNRVALSKGLPTGVGVNDRSPYIVVFTDYRCSYCRAMEKYLTKGSQSKYKIVYKELPVLGDESEAIALVAFTADQSGKYLDFRKYMLSQSSANIKDAKTFLIKNGISPASAASLTLFKESIEENKRLAKKLAIQGTPAIVTKDKILYGWNQDTFSAAIS